MDGGDQATEALASLEKAGLHLIELIGPNGKPLYRVTGNTHPHRVALRAAGGEWDKLQKAWHLQVDCPDRRACQRSAWCLLSGALELTRVYSTILHIRRLGSS